MKASSYVFELVAVGLLKVRLKPMFASLTHLTPTNEKFLTHEVQKVTVLAQVAQLLLQAEHMPFDILFIYPIKNPSMQLTQTLLLRQVRQGEKHDKQLEVSVSRK